MKLVIALVFIILTILACTFAELNLPKRGAMVVSMIGGVIIAFSMILLAMGIK